MKIECYQITIGIAGERWTVDYIGMPTSTEILDDIKEDQVQSLKNSAPVNHPQTITKFQRFRDLVLEYGVPEDDTRHCKHLGVNIGYIKVTCLRPRCLVTNWMEAIV